jgi:hypothetical protein
LLFVVCCLLFVVCCLLFVVVCGLVVYCLLLLLLVVVYLLWYIILYIINVVFGLLLLLFVPMFLFYSLMLQIFHVELKNYCESMTALLQRRGEREVQLELSSWYSSCIEYISRCVQYLFTDLSVLLHAILFGKSVVITGSSSKHDDLAKLLQSVSIVNLSPQDDQDDQTDQVDQADVETTVERLVVVCEGNSPPVLNGTRGSNAFCEQWAKKLCESNPADSFKLRTLLEDLKLQVCTSSPHHFSSIHSLSELTTNFIADHG